MAERYKTQSSFACSPEHWDELLKAMNKPTDQVEVSREALSDVLTCHARCTRQHLSLHTEKLGRTRVIVARDRLFSLVQVHGTVCGHG